LILLNLLLKPPSWREKKSEKLPLHSLGGVPVFYGNHVYAQARISFMVGMEE
jgi:hypothetical protein